MSNQGNAFVLFRVEMTMRLTDMFIRRRPDLVQERKGEITVNQTAVAAEIKADQSTVGRLFNPNRSPTFSTLALMATVLQLDFVRFFNELFGDSTQQKEAKDIFYAAKEHLSKPQIEYLTDKINTMLQAKQMLIDDPDLYNIIYANENSKGR